MKLNVIKVIIVVLDSLSIVAAGFFLALSPIPIFFCDRGPTSVCFGFAKALFFGAIATIIPAIISLIFIKKFKISLLFAVMSLVAFVFVLFKGNFI